VDSGEEWKAGGIDDIAARMARGAVKAGDLCAPHVLAPWREMRKACDGHFALRKLYDPVGAYSVQVGLIVGGTLAGLFLIAHFIVGVMTMGGTYLLAALFGVLAIALTPTVVGLIVLIVVARACGIPLLGAVLGVGLVLLTAVIMFFIGMGIGYGITWVIATLAGAHKRRAVSWG
jgi:hypothetical protein